MLKRIAGMRAEESYLGYLNKAGNAEEMNGMGKTQSF